MVESNKQTSFKEVYIVQQPENNVTDNIRDYTSQRPLSQENYVVNRQMDVAYKRIEIVGEDPPAKQENYDFKNLAINNYIQRYSKGQEMFRKQQLTSEIYSENKQKINPNSEEKLKLYLSTLAKQSAKLQQAQQRNIAPQKFAPAPLSQEYTGSHENATENIDDPSSLHTANTNRSFSHETGKDTKNELLLENRGENQK